MKLSASWRPDRGQVGFTLNSDTPYGAGVIDLKDGPMVIELPPGSYIGLVNDHNQGWVMDMGMPGPDKGKGGKHLVLPPGYKGKVPDGYYVGHSKSLKNLIAVRALPEKGDVARSDECVACRQNLSVHERHQSASHGRCRCDWKTGRQHLSQMGR